MVLRSAQNVSFQLSCRPLPSLFPFGDDDLTSSYHGVWRWRQGICQLQSKSETVHDPKYSHLTALVGDASGFWGPGNQFTSFFLCYFLTRSCGEFLHFHYSAYIAQIYGPRVTRVNFYCPWAGLAQYSQVSL